MPPNDPKKIKGVFVPDKGKFIPCMISNESPSVSVSFEWKARMKISGDLGPGQQFGTLKLDDGRKGRITVTNPSGAKEGTLHIVSKHGMKQPED